MLKKLHWGLNVVHTVVQRNLQPRHSHSVYTLPRLPQATKPGQGLGSQVRVPGVQLEKQKPMFVPVFFSVSVMCWCDRLVPLVLRSLSRETHGAACRRWVEVIVQSRNRAIAPSSPHRTPPKVSNAMSVGLDRIVDFAASSGPRCEFADVSLSLRLAGAPLIEAIKARMAPAGVVPSLTSVVG